MTRKNKKYVGIKYVVDVSGINYSLDVESKLVGELIDTIVQHTYSFEDQITDESATILIKVEKAYQKS